MPRFKRRSWIFCCLGSDSVTSVASQGSVHPEPKEDPRASPSHLENCEACRIEAKYQKRKSFFKFWRKKKAADISFVCPSLAQVQQEIEEQQGNKSTLNKHEEDSPGSPVCSVSGSPQSHRTRNAHSRQSGSASDSHLPGSPHSCQSRSPPDSHLPGSPHSRQSRSPPDSHLPGSPHSHQSRSPPDSHLPGSPHSHQSRSPPDSHLPGSPHSHQSRSPPDSHLPGSPHSHQSRSPPDSHMPGSPYRQRSESPAQSLHSHRSESHAQSPHSHRSGSPLSHRSKSPPQSPHRHRSESVSPKRESLVSPARSISVSPRPVSSGSALQAHSPRGGSGPNVQKFVEDIDARNRAEIAEMQVKFKKKKTPIYRQVSQGVQTLMLFGSGGKSKTTSEKASVPSALPSQAAEQPEAVTNTTSRTGNQTEASVPNAFQSQAAEQMQDVTNANSATGKQTEASVSNAVQGQIAEQLETAANTNSTAGKEAEASVPNAFQSQTSTSEQLQAVANANSTAGEQTEGEAPIEAERDDEWQTAKEELMAVAAPQNQQKQKLMSLGFKETEATQALLATGNNVERAAEWLFSGSSVDSPRKTTVVEAYASLSKSKPLDHIPESIQEIYNKKKIPPITREEYNRGIAEAILETEPINATSLSTVASSSLIYPNITEQVNSVAAFFSDDDNDEEEKITYSFSASDRKRSSKTPAEAVSHSVIQSIASTDRAVDRRRRDTVENRNATDGAGSDDDKGAGCEIM